MSTQVAIACLKTAIGSWLTNRRLQADLRVCPFCQQHEDSLQHFWECDLIWLYVSQNFAPFFPYLGDPLALFGLSPISPYQLFGIHIAFHAYHALRHQANITQSNFSACCRVLLRPCSVSKHLIAAKVGKVSLRFSLPPPPLSNRPSGVSSDQTTSASAFFPPSASETSPISAAPHVEFPINSRLRMTSTRRAKLRASGLEIGSGPLFLKTSSDADDPSAVQVGA